MSPGLHSPGSPVSVLSGPSLGSTAVVSPVVASVVVSVGSLVVGPAVVVSLPWLSDPMLMVPGPPVVGVSRVASLSLVESLVIAVVESLAVAVAEVVPGWFWQATTSVGRRT
ncbi:hypothetical protein [Nannocystis pusilla]|uniref:hypothetical protein n=1 Tax=Nannocystis pusilla TaxID=889268 RepID=UPI003DA3BC4D